MKAKFRGACHVNLLCSGLLLVKIKMTEQLVLTKNYLAQYSKDS